MEKTGIMSIYIGVGFFNFNQDALTPDPSPEIGRGEFVIRLCKFSINF